MRTEIVFTDQEVSEALLEFAIKKGLVSAAPCSAYAIIKQPVTAEKFLFLKVRDLGLPREDKESF